MKKIIILLLLIAASFVSKAQCPYNLDAVDTSWAKWDIYTGSILAGPNATSPSIASGMTLTNHFNVYNAPSRDTMTSGTGLDPYGDQTGWYTLPVVCPYIPGNAHSIRIGNDNFGSQCDRVSYKYRIPATYDRFFAQFYYAFVLENGGHTKPDQPRFTISVIDSATGLKVKCNDFELVANYATYVQDSLRSSPLQPITSFGGVLYKKWTPATINIKWMAGKTVYFIFESGDCSQGGHFGYGYIDFAGCSRSIVQQIGCWQGALTQGLDTFAGPKHSSFASMRWFKSDTLNILIKTLFTELPF
jgi:hypothetical protein